MQMGTMYIDIRRGVYIVGYKVMDDGRNGTIIGVIDVIYWM